MLRCKQLGLFSDAEEVQDRNSSTFIDNMKLPVHRWFRYSAGFSAEWAEKVILSQRASRVIDPFAGSGTTLIAAEDSGANCYGVESHPFVARVARAKLCADRSRGISNIGPQRFTGSKTRDGIVWAIPALDP